MLNYRVFFMDGAGEVEYSREFQAPSDAIALALAEDARGPGPLELWRGESRIRRWEAMKPNEHMSVVQCAPGSAA